MNPFRSLKTGYIKIPRQLINPALSTASIALYVYLCNWNESFPSYACIRRELGMSYNAINRALKQLLSFNMLNYQSGHKGVSNRYSLYPVSQWTLPDVPLRPKREYFTGNDYSRNDSSDGTSTLEKGVLLLSKRESTNEQINNTVDSRKGNTTEKGIVVSHTEFNHLLNLYHETGDTTYRDKALSVLEQAYESLLINEEKYYLYKKKLTD